MNPICALTSFQQYDLVILAQIHEAVDAFSKLHHILNGLCDLHSTELPHHLLRLRTPEQQEFNKLNKRELRICQSRTSNRL